MFLLDDILLAPIKGVLWIFEEIVNAAEEDLAAESDRIKDRPCGGRGQRLLGQSSSTCPGKLDCPIRAVHTDLRAGLRHRHTR